MSIKVLLVLSLIAAAACSPAPVSTGTSVGNSSGVQQNNGTGLVGGLLKGIFGTINGVATLATSALDVVLNITIGALTDVFSLIVNLSLVLQVILNNLVAGLGSLFVRLVACIIKIAVCVLGFPGDKSICAAGWNAKFGITGEASTAAKLVVLFRLNNAQAELNGYIDTISNGKGTSSTSGSVRTVLEKITTLVTFITNYQQISKKTVTDTFVILTTVCGSISNSIQANSGVQIIQKIVPECGKYFKQQGYADITVQITAITNECSSSNGDNINWNGNTGATTGANTGVTTGSNTGGTTEGTTVGTTAGTTEGTTVGTTTGTTEGTTVGTTTGTTEGTTVGTTTGTTGGTTAGTTGGSTGVSVSVGVGSLIKGIFGAINGVVNLASSALDAVLNITIGALTDVFSLIVNLSLVLQVILNNLVAGLGSLFVRLVACIVKIAVCILGFPGDSGICAAGWNAKFGITGEASTAADLVILFSLNNAQVELNGYINTISNGQGTSSTNGSVRTVLEKITTLVTFITNYQQISKTTVTDTFVILTTVCGSISNSIQANSGVQIIQNIVPECGKYFIQQGYADITVQITTITNECSSSNGDNVNWNGNTGATTDANTGVTTGSNTGGTIETTTGTTTEGTTAGTTTGATVGTTTGTTVGTTTGTTVGTTTGTTGGTTTGTTGGSTGVSVGVGVGSLIKGIFGAINGVVNLASSALDAVLNITIGALTDVFSLIVNLSLVLQVILNNLVAGLGSLFVRLVACIVKIAVCILGFPGDSGICAAGWNAKFGITGEASTAADLVILFRLNNAQVELNGYINTISNGNGTSSTNGSVRTVLEKITTLVTFITNYQQISKTTVTDTFVILTTVCGSISNSIQANSGVQIIQNIVPECGKYFTQQGYADITVQITAITNECSSSNGDNINWNGNT